MTYIKKLAMQGFKSFARKTELPFTSGINVVLGPNGSGKSNITDALCFVLGRLSAKSMRAAKAKNLIFLGTRVASASKEAVVEIVFDNEDKTFTLDDNELSIKRILRKNGQSIYKINGQTKTRQEVLSLLAQAGIDPNGYNLILQGEIQNLVRMHTDERRKIIEEVSGISIYEMRKEKSLKELTKTEEKLKEIMAVLRERTSYLNNLEKERQQALRFQKLQDDSKKFKASILYYDLTRKKKESEIIDTNISKKDIEIQKIKKLILSIEVEIQNFESKINSINSTIQKSTGLEQEKLNQEIANIRAEIAGMSVKIENHENKLSSISKQKKDLQETIKNDEIAIRQLQKDSPTIEKNRKEIEMKKKELEILEDQRKKFYTMKSELKSVRERLQDKKTILQNYTNESEFLLKQIKLISEELFDRKTSPEKLNSLKVSLAEKKDLFKTLAEKEVEFEKISYANESEIEKQNKLIEKIATMDVCPLCKNEITKDHINSIKQEISPQVESLKKEIENSDKKLAEIYKKRKLLNQEMEQITLEISKRESDLVKLANIEDKKNQIKTLQEKLEKTKEEVLELEKSRKRLEDNFDENSNIEQRYETVRVEVQEISIRTNENITSEISFKQREFERSKISLNQLVRDEEDLNEELKSIRKVLKEKEETLQKKRKQEEELSKKFQTLIAERDAIQKKIRDNEWDASSKKTDIHGIEQTINNLKIDRAKISAEIENLETELLEFPNVEIIKTNREVLVNRLKNAQEILSKIGSVNMRSLEVYDSIKKEYDSINEKVETISKEKEGILKIIHEIDIKKKKAFLKTLEELNEIFSRNFAQLSTKGQVYLELENKKSPFDGGVNIIVKTGHGKYFDVKSLSGGEQTLVALSLIFGIQELNPYPFYLLDEIDAALDKRNSSRLAGLLRKYMQKGQYLVITHNDEIITNATNLYGVSMHDGVSKVLSLKL